MPTISLPVICSMCGKRVRGTPTLGPGRRWRIRRHKRPSGLPCTGHLLTDHREVT